MLVALRARNGLASGQRYYSASTLPRSAEIVICGGGIVGTSLAHHLASLNQKNIVLLESNHVASGSSAIGNALVSHAFSLSHSEDRMIAYSQQFYRSIIELQTTLNGSDLLKTGSVQLARTPERLLDLRRMYSRLRSLNIPVQMLGVSEIQQLMPLISVKDLEGGLHLPADYVLIRPAMLAQTLADSARRSGVSVVEQCTVNRVRVADGRVSAVETSLGTIKTRLFVNAAGVWSARLAAGSAKVPIGSGLATNAGEYGIELPAKPCVLNRLVTQTYGNGGALPALIDKDMGYYTMTNESGATLITCQKDAREYTLGNVEPASLERQSTQIDEDWKSAYPILEELLARMPNLSDAQALHLIRHADMFTVDGRPLCGPALGEAVIDGYHVATGFHGVGYTLAGGLTKLLADLIVSGGDSRFGLVLPNATAYAKPTSIGASGIDLWPYATARFMPDLHTNEHFVSERIHESFCMRFSIEYPHRQAYRCRQLRTNSIFLRLKELGAVFEQLSNGYERPLYYDRLQGHALEGDYDESTTRRGDAAQSQQALGTSVRGGNSIGSSLSSLLSLRASDNMDDSAAAMHHNVIDCGLRVPSPAFFRPPYYEMVQREYQAAKEHVCMIDMSAFAKVLVESPNADELVAFLQRLASNDVNQPVGNVVHTGFLNEFGAYENDVSIARLAEHAFLVIGPPEQEVRTMRWLMRHRRAFPFSQIAIRNVTADYTVLNLVGPLAESLLESVSQAEMLRDSFRTMTCKYIDIGSIRRVLAMRLTHTGEDGWILYVPNEHALHVFDTLVEAGQRSFSLVTSGSLAYQALRTEKFLLYYGVDVDATVTPFEIGREFRVKLDKGDFVGRNALLNAKERLQRAAETRRFASTRPTDERAIAIASRQGLQKRIVHLTLLDHGLQVDPWPFGGEPIYRDDRFVGITTCAQFSPTLNAFTCIGYVSDYDTPHAASASAVPLIDTLYPPSRAISVNEFVSKRARFEIELAGRRFKANASLYAPKFRPAEIVPLNSIASKS